jgi:hypothetical protein
MYLLSMEERNKPYHQTGDLVKRKVKRSWSVNLQDLQCASFGICGFRKDIKSLHRPLMLLIALIINPVQQYNSRFDETAHIVNMAICVIIAWKQHQITHQTNDTEAHNAEVLLKISWGFFQFNFLRDK